MLAMASDTPHDMTAACNTAIAGVLQVRLCRQNEEARRRWLQAQLEGVRQGQSAEHRRLLAIC